MIPPGPPGKPRFHVDRAWVVIGAVLLGAVGVMVVGALMAPDHQDEMWVNIVSRGAQLIALALAGGVVGAVIHDRDAARDDVRRQAAAMEAFLAEVEAAYREVKSSRRLLRTYGFDLRGDTLLTAEEAAGFRTQMAVLNEAELAFEQLARRVEALPGRFGHRGPAVVRELNGIHGYLNDVLHEWQADPSAVWVGSSTAASSAWPRFRGFLRFDDDAEFRAGVVDRVLAIELLIGGAVLPGDTGDTQIGG
jgi:uncharacterized membrane protein YccC